MTSLSSPTPPDAPSPGVTESANPRGGCAVCGAVVRLNGDGGLRAHRANGERCVGSGVTPEWSKVAAQVAAMDFDHDGSVVLVRYVDDLDRAQYGAAG